MCARARVRACECTPNSRQAERMMKRRAKSAGLETETAENSFHPTYFSMLGAGGLNPTGRGGRNDTGRERERGGEKEGTKNA